MLDDAEWDLGKGSSEVSVGEEDTKEENVTHCGIDLRERLRVLVVDSDTRQPLRVAILASRWRPKKGGSVALRAILTEWAQSCTNLVNMVSATKGCGVDIASTLRVIHSTQLVLTEGLSSVHLDNLVSEMWEAGMLKEV